MKDQENRKTIIYVLVAGMALLVAWEPWRFAPADQTADTAVGTKLLPEFKDPLAAKSLDITRFDEATATLHPFKVSQVDGRWAIPSHNNYPADAQQHMADAATALLNLEILNVVSSNPGDRELYGVISPDPKDLRPGMTDVGTRVTLRDAKDKVLADVVIGKEDKGQPGIRFVRRADRDQIYKVKVATDKLSTKFEDWIEKDLLKLNAFDVRQVAVNDYSIEERVSPDGRGIGLVPHPRLKMKLAYDDTKSAWSVLEMSEFDEKRQPKPATLAEDEELNNEKLNGLKTALDDLQIVDVERKPKGLSEDLKVSEEFVKDAEAQASLVSRGFYPAQVEDRIEMFSSEGEATCSTKEGVRYVLRFGNLAGGMDSAEEKKEGDEKPKSNPALNRYLFVMAQFDESLIPKPTLEPVPGEDKPEAGKPADAKAEEAKPADAPAAPSDDAKQDGAKEDAKNVPENKTSANEQEAPPAAPEAKAEDQPKADGEEKKADEKAEEKPEAPPTPEEAKKIEIRKENKRKQDEYDDAVKKGQEKVKELNGRFADWYFIISDDIYKKIHLGRADVVKKKEAPQPTDPNKPAGATGLPAVPELKDAP